MTSVVKYQENLESKFKFLVSVQNLLVKPENIRCLLLPHVTLFCQCPVPPSPCYILVPHLLAFRVYSTLVLKQ